MFRESRDHVFATWRPRIVGLCLVSWLGISPSLHGLVWARQPVDSGSAAVYDTVVVRGTVDETDSLFIYGGFRPFVELFDSTTVLFADRFSGRLVCADLITGEGWEVGGRGGSGPGEFGGQTPFYSSSGGFIYTATPSMQGATFTGTGEVVEAVRYPSPFLGGQFPMGLLRSGVVVTHFRTPPDRDEGAQQIPQGLRAYSRDAGLIWTNVLPPIESAPVSLPNGRTTFRSRGTARVRARHSTIVWTRDRESEVVALRADGSERGRLTLEHQTHGAFVSSDERIWVRVPRATTF